MALRFTFPEGIHMSDVDDCCIANDARILVHWKDNPNSDEMKRALFRMMAPTSKFSQKLKRRLWWAILSWPGIRWRLPEDPLRNDRQTIDDGVLDGLVNSVMQLLLTEELHGKNAFGLLAEAERASGATWSDVACLVFLLGQERVYLLPRHGQSAGNCPTLWRFVCMKWRQPTKQIRLTRLTLSDTRTFDQPSSSNCQNTTTRHNGHIDPYLRHDSELDNAHQLEDFLEAISHWPISDREIFLNLCEGVLLKRSSLQRLLSSSSPAVSAGEFEDCINTSSVQTLLGCTRRQAEVHIQEFVERLLAVGLQFPRFTANDVRSMRKMALSFGAAAAEKLTL